MTTILIVDDDPMVLDGTQTFLETKGFQTICAKDGDEALAIVKDHHVDIALVDIFMPKRGGFETIGQMNRNIPIIAMSGVSANRFEPLDFAKSLGARASLNKPFHPSDLLSAIHAILEDEILSA